MNLSDVICILFMRRLKRRWCWMTHWGRFGYIFLLHGSISFRILDLLVTKGERQTQRVNPLP